MDIHRSRGAEEDQAHLPDRVAHLEADVARPKRVSLGALEAFGWAVVSAPMAFFAIRFDRPGGMLWPYAYDAIHVVLSGLLGLVALRLSRRLLSGVFHQQMAHYVVAGVVVGGIGGAIEALQIVGPGDASVRDFVRDILGGLSALLFAWGLATTGSGPIRVRRWALHVAGLGALCLAFYPTARAVGALALRLEAFPMLADFEGSWERRFVNAEHGAVLDVQAPPPRFSRAHGNAVGRLLFRLGRFPGLHLGDLVGDWSSYDSLVFEVYSPENLPVSLNVRVHDRHHKNEFSDRFNSTVLIPPGQTTVSIPLESIRNGPASRKMEMSAIRGIIVFIVEPPEARRLYFDAFRLE